jgi:hypothetical protein
VAQNFLDRLQETRKASPVGGGDETPSPEDTTPTHSGKNHRFSANDIAALERAVVSVRELAVDNVHDARRQNLIGKPAEHPFPDNAVQAS